ncbi:MAG TPA: SRPBCC family protein [Pseudonocardiaceae bacterium]|nr:SRPBCC family protein [Pseudonocardiaceae bacterium]
MRTTEGLGVQSDIQIGAAPSRVWAVVTDIEVPVRLSKELQRVAWLDGATCAALGATFAGYNRHVLVGEWRTVSHVVEFDVERAFSWAVTDHDGRFGDHVADSDWRVATWRFTLAPEDGGTRLGQSVRIGPARSGLTYVMDQFPEMSDQVVDVRLGELRAAIDVTLAGIRDLVLAGRG